MARKTPIFYSALLLTGVNLLLRLVSTSFQVYLSGRIGAGGIGLVQLVLSVGMLAMTAGMAGVRTATMYLTAEELGKDKPGNVVWILRGCFRYSLVCSVAVAIAVYAAAPWLAGKWIGNAAVIPAVRLLAFSVPISCLCGVMTGCFTAEQRIGTLAAVEVAEQLLTMAVTVAALFLWAKNDEAKACQCVVAGSLAGACFTLAVLALLRLRDGLSVESRIPVRKRLMQAAVPLALGDDLKAGISTTENLMVPKRLALHRLTADPLAAFGLVSGMVFPVLMFPAAILFGLCELLIPELARCHAAGSWQRIRYLVGRSLRVAMLYGFACCAVLYLCAQDICLRLYGSTDAGDLLQRFALLAPMLYCDVVTDAMVKGLGQQKVCVRYNIFTSFLDVVFLFFLLPVYGLEGYFFSFLVTHLINFALSLRRLVKISEHRIRWHVPLLCAGAAVFSLIAASVLPYPWIRILSFFLMFISSLCLFNVLKGEDFRWIIGLLRKKENVGG